MTTPAATIRTRVRGFAEPVARGFGRLGLTPNHLTLTGFAVAILAAVAAWQQLWFGAGLLVLVGGTFDLFDGALARATGRVSRFGAFLDSTLDRAGELVVYLGIAAGSIAAGFAPAAWLSAAAMAAASLVSYTRAKSEGLGFTAGTGMANVGLAPREIRIVILTATLFLVGPFGLYADTIRGREFLTAGLGLITILATITTIQRILHVVSQSEGDSKS